VDHPTPSWPSSRDVSASDREVLAAQLGRVRYDAISVLTRCPAGYPQVVLGFERERARRFSRQVVWLTCPHLSGRVSQLESVGRIANLTDEISRDEAAHAALAQDQSHYEAEARALLARFAPWAPLGVEPFGIGGVADRTKIKCLHAHVAWALASGRGLAGRKTIEALLLPGNADPFLCTARRCPGLSGPGCSQV
jgi:hypothetical protein